MATDRNQLWGIDLELATRGAGLDLTPNNRGDLALAAGAENITQALALRLRVKRGELAPLGWPDYGSRIHELIGEHNIPRVHQRLLAYAREALEEDPRVVEVVEASATAVERSLARLVLTVQLIDEPQPLNLVYDVRLEGEA